MAEIHFYKNNPTAGGVDGSLVSEETGSNPIINTTPLSVVTGEESGVITLALRTDAGFKTSGDSTVAPIGTNKNDWALSLDGITWLAWGAMLTITAEITAVNMLFYAKCKSVTGESVANDVGVDLRLAGNLVAV